MALFLAPILNDQQEDFNGDPLSGGTIEIYLAGTSTAATTYNDKDGLAGHANTWPITLNTLGLNTQGAVWLTGGVAYKFVIKSADPAVVQRTIDNVSGINDTTVAIDQWVVYQGTPTYVSATSFTVGGDQTQVFQVGRRLKSMNTGGTIYSTITTSTYSAPNTTITVRNDSGVLDPGLSQVSYGLISVQNSSVTGLLLNVQSFTASGTYTPTPGTTKIHVKVLGGGGGGGAALATGAGQISLGGGGGAGAFGETLLTGGFYPTTTVTIGNGGTGNIAGTGNAGGSSAFGAFITCTGGGGGGGGTPGALAVAGGGGGGACTGGTIINGRGAGGCSVVAANAWGIFAAGPGASTGYGSGAIAVTTINSSATGGANATGFGAGGGGSAVGNSLPASAGGTGSPGFVIVFEYA